VKAVTVPVETDACGACAHASRRAAASRSVAASTIAEAGAFDVTVRVGIRCSLQGRCDVRRRQGNLRSGRDMVRVRYVWRVCRYRPIHGMARRNSLDIIICSAGNLVVDPQLPAVWPQCREPTRQVASRFSCNSCWGRVPSALSLVRL